MAAAIANIFLALSRLLQIARIFAQHRQDKKQEKHRQRANEYETLIEALKARRTSVTHANDAAGMSDDGFRRD